MSTFDRDAVINTHRQKKQIKAEYSKKGYGLDLSIEDLALISATYPSAQQYGPKMEQWLCNKLGWETVSSAEGRGDVKVKDKEIYIEVKTNIRTDVGPGGLQHRFWQPIDYYLYVHIDDSNSENITVDLYLLTHSQVLEESILVKAVPTHGTKAANSLNENIEYSMGVKYGSSDHLRWKDKYKVSIEDLNRL